MYEPTYPPTLTPAALDLSGMRFGISHLNEYRNPADPSIEPVHVHPYPEFFFSIRGEVSFLINNRLHPVRVGDVVISRAGDTHMCVFEQAAVHESICLWIDAEEDSPLFSFLKKPSFYPLVTLDDPSQDQLRKLLLTLLECSRSEQKPVEQMACLLQFLLLLDRAGQERRAEVPIPPALQAILNDIDEHFAGIQHIDDLLKHHFVSPATLNRWFRKYIHLSPRQFIEQKKLTHAAKLLTQGATVTEACMQSGFSDCSHFIALFKKKHGLTPLQYKRHTQTHHV